MGSEKKEMQQLLFSFDEIKCFVAASKMCYSIKLCLQTLFLVRFKINSD